MARIGVDVRVTDLPEVKALIAEVERRLAWQPIDTAPDETSVLTFRGAGLMSVAERIRDRNGRREWCCTDGVFLLNVTHWMPLPAPPEAK